MSAQDSKIKPDNPAALARFVRSLADAEHNGSRLYNGYGLWLWHTGDEWGHSGSSVYNRVDKAVSYVRTVSQAVHLAMTTDTEIASVEELNAMSPSSVSDKIRQRLMLDSPESVSNVSATSNFTPDILVLDLEHFFLGTRGGEPRSLEFLNLFVKQIGALFPSTKIAVTTYGDAGKYVRRHAKAEAPKIEFDIDYILPQAYHGGYFDKAKDYFVERRTSVTNMSLTSWMLSGKDAFDTFVGTSSDSILPAGMPIIRKGKLDGESPRPGDPGFDFTTSWPLYLMKGPAVRCWWSDTIMTRMVTNDHNSLAPVERAMNYDMMTYYYIRMAQLGYGPNQPIYNSDAITSSVDADSSGDLLLRDGGPTYIHFTNKYIDKPESMSDLTFDILCALDLAMHYKSQDDPTIPHRKLVAGNCVNFNTANFLSALALIKPEEASEYAFSGAKDLTISDRPFADAINIIDDNGQISVRSQPILRDNATAREKAKHKSTPAYDVIFNSSSQITSLIKMAKEHDPSRAGIPISFNFVGKLSITVSSKSTFGDLTLRQVPLISNESVVVTIDEVDFAPHDDFEYYDEVVLPDA
jgi:hypothetical protein